VGPAFCYRNSMITVDSSRASLDTRKGTHGAVSTNNSECISIYIDSGTCIPGTHGHKSIHIAGVYACVTMRAGYACSAVDTSEIISHALH